jgi:hypothetical protein
VNLRRTTVAEDGATTHPREVDMSTTETTPPAANASTASLSYEVFVNDPPPQDNGVLPNGEPKLFSP